MINVGVVGATGYTGLELLRLLSMHPNVNMQVVTSRGEQGRKVADVFPGLRGAVDLTYVDPEEADFSACQLVFFAAPNGTAMRSVPALLAQGVKVIDLAADFRLKDVPTWEHWYSMEHACPELVEEAVYGLPEINREAVANARLVANPGCYPTAVTLGLWPLLESGWISHQNIIADCKSGVTGAGRKAAVGLLLAEASDNFKAYSASGHRHHPEIAQTLSLAGGKPVDLTFVPHLLPVIRGINATLYGKLETPESVSNEELQAFFEARYANEPFVDVLPFGSHPETRTTRGANVCRISIHRPLGGDRVVILSVIDNLVKGAAGQAIQNMNLMFGISETTGLERAALAP